MILRASTVKTSRATSVPTRRKVINGRNVSNGPVYVGRLKTIADAATRSMKGPGWT